MRAAAAALVCPVAFTVAVAVALGVAVATAPAALARPAGESQQIVPDEHTGDYPTSRYEIWYDDGGRFSVGAKTTGWVTEFLFASVRQLVGLATWLITWAYSFGFAEGLAGPAGHLAETYERGIVGRLELRHLALFCAVVYAGWQVLRNRFARGVGELAVSLVVLVVGGALLAHPTDSFRHAVGFAAGLSGAVLHLAAGSDDADAVPAPDRAAGYSVDTAALGPLTAQLRGAFVAQPHDILNWGEVLAGRCADQRDEVLASGPHGTDDTPREVMREGGSQCEAYAEFNERPTMERLMGAGLTLLAALLVLVVMMLVAITVVVAQLVGVVLVAVMPFAVSLGVMPGGGRQMMWRWAAAALRCVLAVVAMAALLAFMLVTAAALLGNAEQTLLERFGLLVVLAAALILVRKRMLAGTEALARNLDRRLEGAKVGGTHGGGWMRPAAVGGLSGFGVARLTREGEGDIDQLRHNRMVNRVAAERVRHKLHPGVGGHRRALHARRGEDAAGRGQADAGTERAGGGRASPQRGGAAAERVGQAVKTAANLSINLPVSAPRTAAKASVRAGQATRTVQARLQTGEQKARAAGRQWRHGAAHPVDQYRRERDRLRAEVQRRRRPRTRTTR